MRFIDKSIRAYFLDHSVGFYAKPLSAHLPKNGDLPLTV